MKAINPDYADNHEERSWSTVKKIAERIGVRRDLLLHEHVTRNWRVTEFSSLLCRPANVQDGLYEVDEA